MDYSLSSESDCFETEAIYHELSSNGFSICRGCSTEILDQYHLRVNECSWHEDCLKCDYCSDKLSPDETCFLKKNKLICKTDYQKHFGIKCAKCSRNIQTSDWVRRAKDNVYHLACFACDSCKRQLSTGEEFALQDNQVLCKTHYCELVDGESCGKDEDNSKSKNKRVRTTFTEEQLQVLQANFDFDSNPDGQDLERIAQVTGLSKRVTQVWFQNSRARQKKYKEKKIDADSESDGAAENSNDENWDRDLSVKKHHQIGQQIHGGDYAVMVESKINHNSRQSNIINTEKDNLVNLSWGSSESIYESSLEVNQDM